MTAVLAFQLGNIWVGLAVAGFLFVCLIMILTVLIQKPQGGGLSGAFGSGAGSGQTAFGAKTGDALTVFTIIIFVVYICAAVGLNFLVRPGTPGANIEPVASEQTPEGATPVVPANPADSTTPPVAPPFTPPDASGAGTPPVAPPPAGDTPAPTTGGTPAAPTGTPAESPTPPADPTPAPGGTEPR
jgi:preprotein translocase subunit SecG